MEVHASIMPRRSFGGSAVEYILVWHSNVIVLVVFQSAYVHVHIQIYAGHLFTMYVIIVDADIVVWNIPVIPLCLHLQELLTRYFNTGIDFCSFVLSTV